jgi:hypothetical protein
VQVEDRTGRQLRDERDSGDLSGVYARRSFQEPRSCRHLPRSAPVVDHLADLALWEAELAAGSVTAEAVAADPLSVASSLLDRLRQVPDPRRLRGLRHPLLVILVLTACATLVAGNDSVAAIRQWAARTPQDVLHRLGARYNPWRGRYTVPSERTFRRVLAALDGDALDTATCGYAADVVRGDAPGLLHCPCPGIEADIP